MTLPPQIEWALREIGVMAPAPKPSKAPPPPQGTFYPDGDIPH